MLSNLKLVRMQKGYKAKEVAERLKVSAAYISKLENGAAVVTMEIRAKLAALYGVHARDLI